MSLQKPIKVHYITFLIGFAQMYAWATTYYLPATLLKIVPIETGQSSIAIIGGFSWALLIGGLCAPKIGRWIEHEGGRRPLAAGSLLMGLGLIVLSQTSSLIIWYLAWTLIGLGMALGLFNATFAALGRLLGQSAKTIIIRVTLISGFATVFWPITTYLIDTFGWRIMAIIYAIPHLILWAPLFFCTFPSTVPDHEEHKQEEERLIPEKIKLVFYLLALYAIIRAIVGTTVSVDILALFTGLGLTLSTAALSASFIGPAQILGRILEMYFGQNFDPLKSSIFWTAVLPLSIILLLILGPPATKVFAIAYGMSNGVLTITMGILPMILFGSKGYASLLGKLALPVLIAQAATPILVDPLLKHLSANTIFTMAGILGLVSLICLVILTQTFHKNKTVATNKKH
ncbi:MAG: MFS transporter [Legionella sp.]|jgi:MFS family permease